MKKQILLALVMAISPFIVHAETWTDVTGFITNPSFTNNRSFGWTRDYSGSGVTSVVQYECMEVWNGICDIHQTLQGLPKGQYRLFVQAFYREASQRNAYPRWNDRTDNITAVLYAGNAEQKLRSNYEYSFTSNVADSCWTPNQQIFYPNGMASTRVAFDDGAYMNTLDFEADGDIEIGIKNDVYEYDNWVIFDNFRLEYMGNITPVSDIVLNLSKTTLTEGDCAFASAAVLPQNATIKNLSYYSSDPFVFCVNQEGEITAISAGTAVLTVMTNDEKVKKEVVITVEKKETADDGTWKEMPNIIINPIFDTDGNSEGWNTQYINGTTAVRSGSMEFWNTENFNVSQIIDNLPQGHYRLSVQGFHRYGRPVADYDRFIDYSQTSYAYLFVNGQKKTMVPYCSYFEQTKPGGEWISPDGGYHWMPNTMESASEAFAKDAYWNYLEFDVKENAEDVTIGIGLDEYSKENWCIFTNFRLETSVEIDLGKTYTMSVQDESGNDLTSKVNIIWYDGQGNELGKGSSIGGIKKATELFYSVLLDQSLGMNYRELVKQKFNKEDETVVCQLETIEALTLHGKVMAYGMPLPRVNVVLKQWLNGKYEYDSSELTDANGEFSLKAYNDSTELIVTANGYMDNKTTCRYLNKGGELGEIDMIEVQGKVVVLNLSYQEATREGEAPVIQNWYDDTRNIEYIVKNVTKGKEITDFAVQQGNIVMPTGTDRGDIIQITVRSLNEKFAEATVEDIIAENDTANVSINLLAIGGIEVTIGQKADEQILVMLYDNECKLQMRTVSSTPRLAFTNLASGNYTLVTMGYNGTVGSVADISDLSSMNLVEGSDYVSTRAIIRDGVISVVNIASVPKLDATKFDYIDINTSFMPNKNQLVVGDFITLTARLDFKEQYVNEISNVKIIVEIPDGCEFIPNSVVIGAKPIPHSLNGNRLAITVDKEDLDRRIRFCVIPTQSGKYFTSALAEFNYKGSKAQSIGQVVFEGTSGELSVPSTTRTTNVAFGGIGVPKADVEVYDNDVLIGTTKALANGKWTLVCELNNAYNLSSHNIYVQYRGAGNVVGKTESVECVYNMSAITAKRVTMLNIAHPAGHLTPTQYETIWDFENLDGKEGYYSFWPDYPDFTFLIEFTENDLTKVSDVVLSVYTTDGDTRNLHANYDEKRRCFVATSSFDSYCLPVTVSVDFNSETKRLADQQQLNDNIDALISSYENEKEDIQNINSIFEQINTINETPTLYDNLLKIIENKDFGNKEFLEYVNTIKNQGNLDYPDDISALDAQYEDIIKQYNDFTHQYSVDSIYAVFGYSKDMLNGQKPLPPYNNSFTFNGQTSNFKIEQVTNVNEEELLNLGYVAIETVSGSKIYYLSSDEKLEFIDCNKNIKFVCSYGDEIETQRRVSANDYLNYLDASMPFAPSFIATIDNITRLFSTRGYDQEALRIRIHLLEIIINNVDDSYTKMRLWTNNTITNFYSKYKESSDRIIDLLTLLENSYEQRSAKVINNSAGIYLSDSEVDELSSLIKKKSNVIKTKKMLESARLGVDNLYQLFEDGFKKIPKSCKAKFSKGAKITGKLLGGFGLLLQLSGLYDDIVEARDLYKEWIDLLNGIDRKIPCQYNMEGALNLQNAIRHDAQALSYNIDRVLRAEIDAIKIDFVSFVLEVTGVFTGPGVVLTEGGGIALGFASTIPSIYAEWSKTFSINGKFADLRASYWGKINALNCNCTKQPCTPDNDDKSKKNKKKRWWWPWRIPKEDPSGYVYEAVPSNRIKGVKATIYCSNNATGDNPTPWEAEEFGEINPQITNESGLYAWDVPQGFWKVIFEKEGYETAETDWLPVPPPQLEINIPMSQAIAPSVENTIGLESGVTLEFNKYMRPNTMTPVGRVTATVNGKNVDGDVQLLNAEQNPFNKELYASKIKFVPNLPFKTTDDVIITVKKEVKSYAGKEMDEDFVQQVKIESEITEIACDSVIKVDYQDTEFLELSVLPVAAAKGRTIRVTSTSDMIASTDAQSITLDDEGKARIIVSGELPGNASLHLSMPEVGKEKFVVVNVVVNGDDVVKSPKSSKLSGSTIENDDLLTLTCATSGATIYYTLDGSCPCDEQKRIEYTGPFNLPVGLITLKAIAVHEGMVDSEIAEYSYQVKGTPLKYYTYESLVQTLEDREEWTNLLTQKPNAVAVVENEQTEWASQQKSVLAKNANDSYTCADFLLTDLSQGYSSNASEAAKTGFFTPVSFKVTKGAYKRQAYAGYNTLCLPFSFKASELSSSAKVFTFDAYDADKTKVVFKAVSGTIAAGTPCIVKEKADVVWTVDLAGKTIVANLPSEESHMRGTYVTTDAYRGKGYSPRSSDGKFAPLTQYLHPFRACFSVFDLNSVGARGIISAIFLDEDGVTVIDEINAAGGAADTSKTIYTLSGQRISEVKRSGIYIVNGEKQYIEVK